MIKNSMRTDHSRATIFIRLSVGAVFLSEGIQKFLFADTLGKGRFEKIGLPAPEFLSGFTGTFEILCGTLVVVGLLTRWASIPLIIIMLVAITTTKIPLLADNGVWHMLHESRTDWAMLWGSMYLAAVGGGRYSLDSVLYRRVKNTGS